MKVIALLPVKNEAWVLQHCLLSLSFCDEILAIDDKSTDSTRQILEEFNCTIIPFATDTTIGWSEYAIRNHLLHEARVRQATHIVALDGDEMFSDNFVKEARDILLTLKPCQNLSLPWVDVTSSNSTVSPILSKVFGSADDGRATYNPGFIHIPRVPDTGSVKNLSLPYAVIHFQYLNTRRQTYKKIWYMMSELEKGTRNALRINTTYNKPLRTNSFDVSRLLSIPLPDEKSDTIFWHREKILARLKEKGCAYFEKLDIWQQPELLELFVAEVGSNPKPLRPPTALYWFNDIKNICQQWLYLKITYLKRLL